MADKHSQPTGAQLLTELQERAKELSCLYEIEEILARPDLTPAQAAVLTDLHVGVTDLGGSTLGLAYRVTGNKEYAQKLKEALLHYGGLSRWAATNAPDGRRSPALL